MGDELDLDAVKARLAAATEGPWEHGDRQHIAGVTGRSGPGECDYCHKGEPTWIGVRDINGTLMEAHVHTDPKPWWEHGIYAMRDDGSVCVTYESEDYGTTMTEGDAALIANAPTDLAALIREVERLRAIGPNSWTQAVVAHMDRADKAEAAVARVRELHQLVQVYLASDTDRAAPIAICSLCSKQWPCDTLRALDGETGEQ